MKKVSAPYREACASCGPLHFASCVINFIRVCTRHKLRDKGPRPFSCLDFYEIIFVFCQTEKNKNQKRKYKIISAKENRYSYSHTPIHPTFSFSIYFYLFYFYLPNKIEKYHANISSLFSSSFFAFYFRPVMTTKIKSRNE